MNEVFSVGADERSAPPPRRAEHRRLSAAEKSDRVALHLELQALLRLQHLARRGAERAVVEEGDSGVEEEQFTHGCRDHRIAAAATALRAADVT
ncbi:MAG: hypothetical protein U1F67_07865 [Rubrivivax sp.]